MPPSVSNKKIIKFSQIRNSKRKNIVLHFPFISKCTNTRISFVLQITSHWRLIRTKLIS